MSVHPGRSAACDGPDHQTGDGVDDDGDEEERESDLDERAEVYVAGGLGELSRDDTRESVGGGEEGFADVRVIADDHGDGHGFAERAAETKHNGTDDADARVAQDADTDHLPTCGAESEDGLALAVRHSSHDVAGQGGDDGENHDGEDDTRSQQPHAEVRATEEARPAQGLHQEGTDRVAHQRHEDKDCPEAIDDAGDGGEQLRKERDGGTQWAGTELGKEDGYPERQWRPRPDPTPSE